MGIWSYKPDKWDYNPSYNWDWLFLLAHVVFF